MKVKFTLRDGSVVLTKSNGTTSQEEAVDFFSDLLREESHQQDVAILEPKVGEVVLVRVSDISSIKIKG